VFLKTFTDADHPALNATRRIQTQLLKLISILALIVVPILWSTDAWLFHFVHPIDQVGYPALLLAFGGALLLLNWQSGKYYTLAAFIGGGAFALHMWAFLQNFLYGQNVLSLPASSSSIQWFPLVYVLFFMILERRHARTLSLVFYLSFAIPLCIYVFVNWPTLYKNELLPMYVQIVVCHPFYIASLTYIEIVHRTLAQATVELSYAEISAKSDYLTGIFNRRASTAVLQKAIDDAQNGIITTVMLFDIDHFKRINDTFGHDVGDVVLVAFVALLKEHIRNIDSLGRWGGEEFILILPNIDFDQARILAARLCNVIAKHSFPAVGQVTTSIGVSISQPEDTLEMLVKRADIALYKAKQSGRNQAFLPENCSQVETGDRPPPTQSAQSTLGLGQETTVMPRDNSWSQGQ
jgi:diguanylate cyclase (GGDEF)-like protein